MSDNVRQLLYTLENGKRTAENSSSPGASLSHVVSQLCLALEEALKGSDVGMDQKLACLSLALDAQNPPDLLAFLLWRGDNNDNKKDVNHARDTAIKFCYKFAKNYGRHPRLFPPYCMKLLETAWYMGRPLETPPQASTKAVALHLCTIIFRICPELLWQISPNDDENLWWKMVLETLQSNLRSRSKCTGSFRRYNLICSATVMEIMMSRKPKAANMTLTEDDKAKLQKYVDALLHACKDDLTGKNTEMGKVASALGALSIALNVSEGPYSDASQRKRLFLNIQVLFNSLHEMENTKYGDVVGKALKLLSIHAGFFRKEISERPRDAYNMVEKVIQFNTEKKNARVGKYAMSTMEAFLEVIASETCERQGADLDFFLEIFGNSLDRAISKTNHALIVLRGVVNFVSPLLKRLSTSCNPPLTMGAASVKLLGKLRLFHERFMSDYNDYVANAGRDPNIKHQMPVVQRWAATVLDAAGSVLRPPHADKTIDAEPLSSSQLDWIANLVQQVVDRYELNMYRTERERTCVAMTNILTALEGRSQALDSLLSQIVRPSLTRAITREDLTISGTIQAQIYASMWRRILKPEDKQGVYDDYFLTFRTSKASPVQRREDKGRMIRVREAGFRYFVVESLQLIDRLNLRYRFQAGGETSQPDMVTSQGLAVKPDVVMDHELFLSLVDFLSYFWKSYEPELLAQWSPEILRALVRKSTQLPHVSGFYRLLSRTFAALEMVQGLDPGTHHLSVAEAASLSALCSRYVHHVVAQVDQYEDELLASAINLLLHCPQQVLPDLQPLVSTIRLALKTGVSHAPTANSVVSALERWLLVPSLRPSLDRTLPQILPLLDHYLYDAQQVDVKTESRIDRERFQKRVLRLLGRMGGRNQALLSDVATALSTGLALNTNDTGRLRLSVPFNASVAPKTIIMDLDQVIPRLLRLAERKGDAQIRVLSSECMHAVVVFMVGEGREGYFDFSETYEHVIPVLLRLALDFNVTTRQLYTKLVQQLIHWFSGRRDAPETGTLLEGLSNGLGSTDSGPIRNFCAAGLGEFMKYAVKQRSKKEMAKDPLSVEGLLTRLFSLARHPNRYKRLGAAMGLQYAIRHIREETALTHLYILQILHTAMLSLQYSHVDNEGLGTVDLFSRLVDSALKVMTPGCVTTVNR